MQPKSINEILADKSQFKNLEIDVVDANTMYIGNAKPTGSPVSTSDARWLIVRIVTMGSNVSIRLAENTDDFTLVWDDRTTYTY